MLDTEISVSNMHSSDPKSFYSTQVVRQLNVIMCIIKDNRGKFFKNYIVQYRLGLKLVRINFLV